MKSFKRQEYRFEKSNMKSFLYRVNLRCYLIEIVRRKTIQKCVNLIVIFNTCRLYKFGNHKKNHIHDFFFYLSFSLYSQTLGRSGPVHHIAQNNVLFAARSHGWISILILVLLYVSQLP